jgi:hypothetical protein
MNENFGVGVRCLETVPGGFERAAKFEVIVDFAVIYDADFAGCIPHRLGASFEVNDRQSAMAQEYRSIW